LIEAILRHRRTCTSKDDFTRCHPARRLYQEQSVEPSGKLKILSEPFVPRRRQNSEESVAAFARRRIGIEAAERLVAPFVSGIYAGDADRLSVKAAFPRLANLESDYGGLFRGMFAKAREARKAKKEASAVLAKATPTRRRLCSFRSGMAFLPKMLAAKLGEDVLTSCSEFRIAQAPNRPGYMLEFERGDTRHQLTADRLVIAAPRQCCCDPNRVHFSGVKRFAQ
jgi:oxygen-dependent protoporphyrinogen oxidase